MGRVSVLSTRELTSDTFVLKTERPKEPIRAGQCFNLGMPDESINREYSMYSDANADYLEFIIRKVDNGVISPRLSKMNVGDKIEIFGPYGEFCIDRTFGKKNNKYIFIGTGTGIAPFRSFIKTFSPLNYKVIHGIRFSSEKYDANDYNSNSYISCVSQPTDGKKPIRVTDYIKQNGLSKESVVFLCGNRKMITEVFDLCRDCGINGNDIYTEVFF